MRTHVGWWNALGMPPGAFLLSGLVVDLQQLPEHQARRYDYASPSRERDRRPPPVPPPVRGPSASRSRLPVVAWTGAGGRPAPSDAGGARSGAGARSIQGDPVPVPAWWFLAVGVARGLSFLGRGEIRFRAPYCPVWDRVSSFRCRTGVGSRPAIFTGEVLRYSRRMDDFVRSMDLDGVLESEGAAVMSSSSGAFFVPPSVAKMKPSPAKDALLDLARSAGELEDLRELIWEQVDQARAVGASWERIAGTVGMSPSHLRRLCSERS